MYSAPIGFDPSRPRRGVLKIWVFRSHLKKKDGPQRAEGRAGHGNPFSLRVVSLWSVFRFFSNVLPNFKGFVNVTGTTPAKPGKALTEKRYPSENYLSNDIEAA